MVGIIVTANAQHAGILLAAAVTISSSYVGKVILDTARVRHHSLEAFFDSLSVSSKPELIVSSDTEPHLGIGWHGCKI